MKWAVAALVVNLALALGAPAHAAAPDVAAPTASATAPAAAAAAALVPVTAQAQAASMTAELLTRFHYAPKPLDDAMSQKIFDRYLKTLDGEKLFFLKTDIDQFGPARDKLDDAIKQRDLATPFAMFSLYQQRLRERLVYARSLLAQSPDFALQESYAYQRDKEAWAQSEAELQDIWRRRVKNDWLRLKLAGKADAVIRTTLEKRYDYSLANLEAAQGRRRVSAVHERLCHVNRPAHQLPGSQGDGRLRPVHAAVAGGHWCGAAGAR
jgi:hypothetical protein